MSAVVRAGRGSSTTVSGRAGSGWAAWTSTRSDHSSDRWSRSPLSRAAAERLREHTDGHPLYIRALVDELPEQSLNSEHGPLPAPHSFAATVLARLATLSPAARDLAAAAAVAGPRCRADRALAAAGLDGTLDAA